MSGVKSYILGIFTGGTIALLGIFLWWHPAPTPLLKEAIAVQKNEHEVQKPTNTIIAKGQKVVVRYNVPTQHYGLIQGLVEVPRSALTYKHSIGVGVVILNTSALARVAYSYKSIELSAYLGYDYFTHSTAYGFGIGGRWQF